MEELMNPNEPGRNYLTPQLSADVQGASTTALILEIIFGFFGLLGVGHVYSGRTALGILLMIGWWVMIGVGAFISTLTMGLTACLFGPLYLAGPIISGIQARTHVQREMTTGNWPGVALVAGGGCLLVVITLVIIGILSFGLLSIFSLESY
jgi:hypothetical protein